MAATNIVTRKPIRLSYVNLFTPRSANADGSNPRYSATLLIPKTDTALKAQLDAAIEAARVAAAAKGIQNAKTLKSPIHDGDGEKPNGGEYGKECKGMWVINASSKSRPGVVSRSLQPIIDQSEIYSGVWANVDINFYGFSVPGNRGISCGLNNVQKIRDDTPLGGVAAKAEDVFSAVEDDDDVLGL